MSYYDEANIVDLIGLTFNSIYKTNDGEIIFEAVTGEKYCMYHQQDCCESVAIDSIEGDLNSLVGSPIRHAIKNAYQNELPPRPGNYREGSDSWTWTIFHLATETGNEVIINWLGESNGYYDESVYFVDLNKGESYI